MDLVEGTTMDQLKDKIKNLEGMLGALKSEVTNQEIKIDDTVKDFAEKLKLLKTNDFAVYHDNILNAYVMIVVDNEDPKIHLAKFIIKEMDEDLEKDKMKAKEVKLSKEEVEQMEGLKDEKD